MNVTIFGTGYVGLVTGACLAQVVHNVLCIDVDSTKIEQLQLGQIPIYEPGLEAIVKETCVDARLQFSTDAAKGVAHAEIQFIAVGTPPDEDGSADLKYVLAVAKTIGENMAAPKIIVDKSTVPVGTADRVRDQVQAMLTSRETTLSFNVVSNPEFLKEGAAVSDFMKLDRIIIGTDSKTDEASMRELYAPFNRNHDLTILMDVRSAELTKYAANAMLATKISFMNEIANLAELLGTDIEQVRQGIGSDPRIYYDFIYPGCCYGGSCFPKDVRALAKTGEQVGYSTELLTAVEAVNNRQKNRLFKKIMTQYNGDISGKTFALWGLAFKPKTDDMRDAPSRTLMEALWNAGAKVQAFDPEAMEETQRIYGTRKGLLLTGTKEGAFRGADALVTYTEWQNFKAPDFELIKAELKEPVVFDGRNLYEVERMRDKGFTYLSIGRSLGGINC
jgi:UDPglucose 6-dehydrogenase